jgi:hypothetical protein
VGTGEVEKAEEYDDVGGLTEVEDNIQSHPVVAPCLQMPRWQKTTGWKGRTRLKDCWKNAGWCGKALGTCESQVEGQDVFDGTRRLAVKW